MNNPTLIFDAKKDDLSYSWTHYLKYPEMKKNLSCIKNTDGTYGLIDNRTKKTVMSASFNLSGYLK